MKKWLIWILIISLTFSMTITAFAVGEGNIDSGGGGMGSGTSTNKWIPGEDGVRVSVIRVSDGSQVGSSFDMTNISLRRTIYNFGIYSKLKYREEMNLSVQVGNYNAIKPTIAIPKIISSSSGASSIAEIKRYFCSEYTVQLVANTTGINYDLLISGEYKVVIEPVAYFLFNGNYFAMSAHQAAMYDQILSGGLRAKMLSLTHKNLPLAMFLEHADLGYSAWNGNTTQKVSNDTIIKYLGIGIVRFIEEDIVETQDLWWWMVGMGWPGAGGTPTEPGYNYLYRTDTDVITSINVDADREYNPDNPLTARFRVGSENFIVRDIVIPEDESQLVWIKWHTPDEPQDVAIRVTIGGITRNLIARVEETVESEPPDPKANDRNDSFITPNIPTQSETTTLTWGVWSASWHAHWVWESDWEWTGTRWVDNGQWVDIGWYDFTFNRYNASIGVAQSITPDDKAQTATSNTMKSGYGFNTNVDVSITSDAPRTAYTQAQTSLVYFPEFEYETFFRVLDRNVSTYRSIFYFRKNRFSTYESRAHFTPIWYPDGAYKTYTKVYDAWTPAGMLSVNKTAQLNISGNLYEDWHIANRK